jgi:hypothetical protein
MKDLQGQRFGRWTVVKNTGKLEQRCYVWLCRCDCGTEREVRGNRLSHGKSQSCGCARKESTSTHGQSNSPTYHTWRSMILRCEAKGNDSYRHYGGRGISICERWRDSFEAFLADMGERPSAKHSIDRIDNAKGYEPENCRWATVKEQNRHRSTTKLSEAQVAEIRALYDRGFYQKEIARVFKVTDSLVSMIVSGKIWRPDA